MKVFQRLHAKFTGSDDAEKIKMQLLSYAVGKGNPPKRRFGDLVSSMSKTMSGILV